MGLTTLQMLMAAATLILPTFTMAQGDDIIIKVKAKQAEYFFYIGFDNSVFAEFHSCMCNGYDICTVHYDSSHCPDKPRCLAQRVTTSGAELHRNNQFYTCTNKYSSSSMECVKQERLRPTNGGSDTYRNLQSFPSVCVGFVWSFDKENITFDSSQLVIEPCGANCTCPTRTTTSTPLSPSSTSWTAAVATSSPSTSVSSPTTWSPTTRTKKASSTTWSPTTPTKKASSTTWSPTTPTKKASSTTWSPTTPTKKASSTTIHTSELTSTILTAKTSFSTTDFSAGSKTAGGDAPIAVIIGAVVGVIVVTVVIIIIIFVWRRRRAGAKASDNAGHNETSVTPTEGVGVEEKSNGENSHSYYNTEFSDNSGEVQTAKSGANKISEFNNNLHQPNITKNGVTPVKHPRNPQFAIKDNDSNFGYSKAQLVVPEDNNTKGKKSHDNYDYVYAEDDVGVPDLKSETTRAKTAVLNPPNVRDDYAVVDKTRKNKNPGDMATSKALTGDYDDIPEEDYGYSHAEGDPSAHVTSDAAVGNAHVMVPKSSLLGASDLNQDIGYEYSRTSDGYTTVGNVNQPDPNNDDPNAANVYSRLHEPVRDIQNPYNVGPNTKDVYSKLHDEVRDIKNPYNVLPEAQGASDSPNALPDTAHNAQDTKKQKLSKSLPYGPQDYAVVVKTKSNKPAQSTFELENDDN